MGCCFNLKNIWNTPVIDLKTIFHMHLFRTWNSSKTSNRFKKPGQQSTEDSSVPDLSWPERWISDSLGFRLMRAGLCNWTWPWWPRSGLKNRWPLVNAGDKRRYTWKQHQTCLTWILDKGLTATWEKSTRPPTTLTSPTRKKLVTKKSWAVLSGLPGENHKNNNLRYH